MNLSLKKMILNQTLMNKNFKFNFIKQFLLFFKIYKFNKKS